MRAQIEIKAAANFRSARWVLRSSESIGEGCVLNIGKLRRGGENYYLNSVARGVEDYYVGSGESPGYWLASGASSLELAGEVQELALKRVLQGADPRTGEVLIGSRKGERVPGFDLTFRAPKSVALLHALGPKDASNEVVNAHDAAVSAAMDYMERVASGARRGRNGTTSIESKGFIAAGFRHRTSRSGDPLLHTHVLTANMIEGADGKWGAVDARHLYLQAKTAGFLYQAQLRAELTRRLGVEFDPVHNGTADIKGVPRDVIEIFSTRRKEIEAVTGGGDVSRRAAEIAALETRKAKDYSVHPEDLLASWQAKANSLGLDDEALHSLLNRAGERNPVSSLTEPEAAELAALDGLTRSNSSFSRRDVIQAMCDRLTQGADISQIELDADRFLASEYAIELVSDIDSAPPSFRLSDAPVAAGTREPRHTTPAMLTVEAAVVDMALARLGEGRAVVPKASLDRVLARRDSLHEEQRTMVERLTTSGNGIDLVMGKAGTGKTFALAAAHEAWQRHGYTVLGCALAAQAARELEDGAGITSTTLARLLLDLDDPDHGGFKPDSIVVVDEAAMVGTVDLARLLSHAHIAGAKVVLIGDDHQLPEIQAGGGFKALRQLLPAVELTEVKRQPFGWEKNALDLLRDGRGSEAMAAYMNRDRVFVSPKDEDTRNRLVEDWWETYANGDAAIMVAARHRDVTDLNDRARSFMRTAGRLGPALMVHDIEFAVGDRVMMLRNDRRLGVLNGSRGVVTSIGAAGDVNVVLDDGAQRSLPPSYVADGCLTHGYAITGHKAQGMTTDRAFVLADRTLYREWAYVAMSRGREENRLYVIAGEDEHRRELGGQVQGVSDPVEEVSHALTRSHAKELALDLIEDVGRELSLEI
jgi:Ti-type conjugative transfer relaxase TraA